MRCSTCRSKKLIDNGFVDALIDKVRSHIGSMVTSGLSALAGLGSDGGT